MVNNKSNESSDLFEQFGGKCPIVINYGTYVASGGRVVNNFLDGRHPDMEIADDALAAYILDDELRQRVINALHECTETREVYTKALSLLRQSNIWNKEVMTSKPFLATLIPHLTSMRKKPTVAALYMAVYRQLATGV